MEAQIIYLRSDGTQGCPGDPDSSPYFHIRASERYFVILKKGIAFCQEIFEGTINIDNVFHFEVAVRDSRGYLFSRTNEREILLSRISLCAFYPMSKDVDNEDLIRDLGCLKTLIASLQGIENNKAKVMRSALSVFVAGIECLLHASRSREVPLLLHNSLNELIKHMDM